MEQLVSASLASQRFLLLLFAIFAGLALMLACVGIYSVIAYLTSQRVPEFGVRLALGARSSDIIRLVLRESLAIIMVGIGIGLVASMGSGLRSAAFSAGSPNGAGAHSCDRAARTDSGCTCRLLHPGPTSWQDRSRSLVAVRVR
jgi:hypothetical protein